jgi:hypothetical protein
MLASDLVDQNFSQSDYQQVTLEDQKLSKALASGRLEEFHKCFEKAKAKDKPVGALL